MLTTKPVVEKQWNYNGIDCLVLRMPLGHLCGYVRTKEGHPYCGLQDFEDYRSGPKSENRNVNEMGAKTWSEWWDAQIKPEKWEDRLSAKFDVHGGLTFAGRIPGVDGWYLGFDCNHLYDEERGWTVEEVAYETEVLAKQIAEAVKV
jgi:hypothetical protein